MSTQAMTWAIEQKTGGPSAKTVLWSLANYANQHWCAWPSQSLVMQESEQSADSIQRRIPDLEALGLIRRIPLRVFGRKSVDFIVLAPSPFFRSPLADIEPLLPRGHVIDPKWLELHVAADGGSDKKGTPADAAAASLPQPLPQPADDAAALLRQHESSTEPLEPSRESVRARGEGQAEPDPAKVAATFEALAQAWEHHAKGGRGSIGRSDKALAAIADLAEDEHAIAIERAPRFLRALRDANRHPMGIATYVANREFQHHPPPKNADPALTAPVELKPYVAPLWAMYWKGLHKARQATGNDQLRRRLTDCQTWLERGLTTAAALVPTEEETSGLVAVTIDSPEHLAWVAYGTRVNVRLPRPDHVPVIFMPAMWPPELPLSGAQPYRLAMPARIEVRGPVWWWRAFKRIEDGSPFVSQIGKHRIDPLQAARGQAGFTEADYGPLPLPSEIAAMVEVRTLTDAWDQWAMWIEARGGDIALWPDSRIWCPTEYPTLIFGKSENEKQAGAAA